ncbi:MAG: DUF5939 domain-containing protein [Myxococcaceae bacterium]
MSAPAVRTIEEVHALHPWPTEMLSSGQAPLEFLWHFDLEVTPEELWPLISDTSRVNRALGLSRMDFEEKDGMLRGQNRVLGMAQEWDELPWTWIANKQLMNVRRYRRGIAHWVRAIFWLEPLGELRTRLYIYFGWVPRGRWQRALLKTGMGKVGKSFAAVMPELESTVKTRREAAAAMQQLALAQPAPSLAEEAVARLGQLREALYQRGVDRACVDRLVELVRTGDDMEVHKLQVKPLARRWSLNEESLLAAFLHATRAGLLQLTWDVVCPHCRGVREERTTLGEIPKTARCDVCAIEFGTDAENAIEIAFHIHPSIRHVPELFFCSAEPAKKAHIHVQHEVRGGTAQLQTRLPPGEYRLRVAGEKRYGTLQVSPEAEAAQVQWSAEAPPERARTGPSPTFVIASARSEPVTFVVEERRWSDDALRPASLFSFQEFRDLFSEEYLQADIQLSVGQQTILFTDLVGSTRMYASRGDPGAFADVKRHFTEIYEEVKKQHGVIVKTIGDATMAAFRDPVAALEAAVAIQRRFYEGRTDLPLRVRITLNTGPCIAVKLDTNIDYFGGTVNIAAKLQGWADAGEVTFSRAVYEQPGVSALLARLGARPEEIRVELAALDAPISAFRWMVEASGEVRGQKIEAKNEVQKRDQVAQSK